VTLCLVAQGAGNCGNATDCVTIFIISNPEITSGSTDLLVCYDEAFTFSQVQISNYSTVQWYTLNGLGFFDDEFIVNPTYFPSSFDYIQGCITIGVTVAPISPCSQSVEEMYSLCFQPKPLADAGADETVCQGEVLTISGTADNQSGILWLSSGDGTFSSAGSLTTVYTPGTSDITLGSVVLTLNAYPVSPCNGTATDYKNVLIISGVTAFAGNDITVCEGGVIELANAASSNFNSLLWTTYGDGTFSDATLLHPQYTPGTQDITNGSVNICLTANGSGGCGTSATDCMTIFIISNPKIISESTEITVCYDEA
jgi:hypothetical protein